MKFGFVALAWGVCMPHAFAQPEIRTESPACPPSAVLRGQSPLVTELESELSDLDIGLKSSPDCPSTEVRVEALSSGFFISLQEESGRSAYRQVGTLLIAAIWIDSWLQDDLSASLLAVRSFPGQAPTPMLQSPGALLASTVSSGSALDNSSTAWTVGLAYDRSTASDTSIWQGLRADLRYPFSAVSVGTSIRVANAQTVIAEESEPDSYSQNSQDLFLTLRAAIPMGRSLLIPELSVGYGRLQTSRKSSLCDAQFGPAGVCSMDRTLPLSRSSWAPRAELALALTLPLSQRIRLSLGGAVNIRPFGAPSISAIVQPLPEPLPEPCNPNSDPACFDVPPITGPEELYLPSDPDRFWRLSIGLEFSL